MINRRKKKKQKIYSSCFILIRLGSVSRQAESENRFPVNDAGLTTEVEAKSGDEVSENICGSVSSQGIIRCFAIVEPCGGLHLQTVVAGVLLDTKTFN